MQFETQLVLDTDELYQLRHCNFKVASIMPCFYKYIIISDMKHT